MDKEAFMELVKKHNGFEYIIGYKDDIDHDIGGQDNKYWYLVNYSGKKMEYYLGTYDDGKWTDKFYVVKKDKITRSKTVKPETTINKIIEKAYLYQEKTINKKPTEVDYHSYLCNHFMFGFGDVAVKISKEYGVTVDFNDINDNENAFHLRDILIGKQVEKPKEE